LAGLWVRDDDHPESGVTKAISVPLSEEEQRILHEIERNFYERDPDFARGVSQHTLYRHAGRNCKWAALGFLAGLVVLVVTFATSLVVSFLGFFLMLGCALVFERNLRKMGKAGWQSATQSVRDRGLPDALGDARNRLKKRFRRE
jgi:hypothetical protein